MIETAALYRELVEKKHIIVEGYPGCGKTLAATLLLQYFSSGVIVERTVNEMLEVVKFARKAGLKVVPLYGRPKVCPLFRGETQGFYHFCKARRVLGLCKEVVSDEVIKAIARLAKPEEIRAYAAKIGACVYPSILKLASSKYVVTNYDFLFMHWESLKDKEYVAFDEYHALLDTARISIFTLTPEWLAAVLRKADPEKRKVLYVVRSLFRKLREGRLSREEVLEKIRDFLAYAPNDVFELLRPVYEWDCVVTEGAIHCVSRRVRSEYNIGTYRLYLSAYTPRGFIDAPLLTVEPPSKQRTVIVDSVTSRYVERSEETYRSYARLIEEYCTKDRISLVVFPSYDFMENTLSFVSDSVKQRMVREPCTKPGCIMVDVAGGVLTEGVNLPKLDLVLVAGFPAPKPEDEVKLVSKVFKEYPTYIALVRSLQAVGRLRLKGLAVLADERFKEHKDKLPSWVEVENT